MRSLVALAVVAAVAVGRVAAIEPVIPAAHGFVTDTAHVISEPVRARIERVVTELQQKTGAEIAVLTVESTAPLDDFAYAVRVADTWKPGKKGEDTGIVMLVATKDHKLRIVTGYGVEGVLPDGLIGAIEDQEIMPSFKAGRFDEGIYRGVAAMASRIAASRGVTLTGVPAPRPLQEPTAIPPWVIILIVLVFLLIIANSGGGQGLRRSGGPPVIFFPGPTRFPGGWSDGGGGFGGFGGGGFGGGGAGRSW